MIKRYEGSWWHYVVADRSTPEDDYNVENSSEVSPQRVCVCCDIIYIP